jgi:hypothetical protein
MSLVVLVVYWALILREVSCWGETIGNTHNVSRAEGSGSKSEALGKPCDRAEDSGSTRHCRDNEAVDSDMDPYAEMSVDGNHLKKSRCSEITAICDETSILAHSIIGQILDEWLPAENNEVDELTRRHLGGTL